MSRGYWLGKKRPEMTGKKHPRWVGKIKLICLLCGKYFYSYKKENQRYCSPECGNKSRRGKVFWKKDKVKTVTFTCLNCGIIKIVQEYSPRKYCSQQCSQEYMKGKNSPTWQGGKSFEEYGAEFDNSLKEQIRFRDNYKCKVCGCPQIENGKQLDVHHIDEDKQNNKLENLISLCHRCHLKIRIKKEYWKNYFQQKTEVTNGIFK